MIEDELLKLRFKAGSIDALQRIYQKYRDYLLTLAMVMSNDTAGAEDIVHDVFVSLTRSPDRFKLTGSLKHYLATCVANKARDYLRAGKRNAVRVRAIAEPQREAGSPEESLICDEQARQVYEVLAQVPYEMREVIALRIKAGLGFKQIARMQNASYVAVQARYRRGIETLRSLLNGRL